MAEISATAIVDGEAEGQGPQEKWVLAWWTLTMRCWPAAEPGGFAAISINPAPNLVSSRTKTRATWLPGLVRGLKVLPLHAFGSEPVALVRWAPGTVFQPHGHRGGEEILVLESVFQDEHGSDPAGSWLRNPAGSVHRPWSEAGCTIWVKTGHLPGPCSRSCGNGWSRRKGAGLDGACIAEGEK
jgi:hypothetical protein